MEQDPLTAAKLPLSARPRSSSSPQKEASGPSFKKKKQKKKKEQNNKKKNPKEKKQSRAGMCILTFLSFPLFFSFIFLLSRALSLSLSLCRSRAVARCLADKLCRILQLPRARARVWELRNFDLPAQVEKGALGFKKIIYFIFFKGKKIHPLFTFFPHTHADTRLPALCSPSPSAVSCRGVLRGCDSRGEAAFCRASVAAQPRRPGEKKGDSVRVSLFFLFIYLFPLVLDLI